MSTLEDDTPIMAAAVADDMVSRVERRFGITLGREVADKLCERQAKLYEHSAPWRKKMNARGDCGLRTLRGFMLHWLAADIKKEHPTVAVLVAGAAWYGTPL